MFSGFGKVYETAVGTGDNNYTFTIVAENSVRPVAKSFNLRINATGIAPSISDTTLPSGTVGAAYSELLTASGTPNPRITTTDTLPAGLTLVNNKLVGTPTEAGTFSFTVTATNNVSPDDTAVITVVIDEASATPNITTTSLPNGKENINYSAAVSATGIPAPTFSLDTSTVLPSGLDIASDGTISGVPVETGTFSFNVIAENGLGNSSKSFTITIAEEDEVVVPPIETDDPDISYAPNPMNFDLNSHVTGSINISLGVNDTSTMADHATIELSSGSVRISADRLEKNGNITVTAVRAGSDRITVRFFDETGAEMPEFTKTVPVAIINSGGSTGNGGNEGGSGGSSGGGGGGDGSSVDSSGSKSKDKGVDQEALWDTYIKNVPAVVKAAVKNGMTIGKASIKNPNVITVKRANEIVAAAKKNGGSMTVNADITGANKSVLLRISLAADKVDRDIKLGATINGDRTKWFDTFFSNETHGISFAHQGKLGQEAHISVKLDLTKFDTNNIVISSYNRKANKYEKISNPKYWIDTAGYLHFYTDELYDIIISNGALVKK